MQISIVSLGKTKDPALKALIESYQRKIKISNPKLKVVVHQISDPDPNKKIQPTLILAKLQLPARNTYFLAEWGKSRTTNDFVALLEKHRQTAEDITLICGNAWGWERVEGFNYLSLSALTFNHELAQLMLWEQVYRFVDFTRGGSYTK